MPLFLIVSEIYGLKSRNGEKFEAPKFLHTTFPSKYFVLAEFHHPRLSFGGVMAPTPSLASLQYGMPYSIWQAITNTSPFPLRANGG